MENPVVLKVDSSISFSFSVRWIPSTISFEDRFDVYLDFSFFEHQVCLCIVCQVT